MDEFMRLEEKFNDRKPILQAWSKVDCAKITDMDHALTWIAEAIEIMKDNAPIADRLASIHDALTDLAIETGEIADEIKKIWRES